MWCVTDCGYRAIHRPIIIIVAVAAVCFHSLQDIYILFVQQQFEVYYVCAIFSLLLLSARHRSVCMTTTMKRKTSTPFSLSFSTFLSRFIHVSISHLCARRVPHRLTYNSDETTYFIISRILSLSLPVSLSPGIHIRHGIRVFGIN